MALPVGGVEHLDPGDVELPAVAGADHLRERGHPDADQLGVRVGRGLLQPLGLAATPARVVEQVLRLVQGGVVVAGVVDETGRRQVGELLGPDEVLQPELGRVDAELVGRPVHQPLDDV
jgi:hypothetical protein